MSVFLIDLSTRPSSHCAKFYSKSCSV